MTKYYIQSDSYVESWKNILADLLKNDKSIWLGDSTLPIYQSHRFCKSHLFQSVAQHAAATMSVASSIIGTTGVPVDDGKRYNVWYKVDNRWTNMFFNKAGQWTAQDTNSPRALTYQEAEDLMRHICGGGSPIMQVASPFFEIRELPNATNQPTSIPVAKSTGMNCVRCNDFNTYAEANMPNGTFKCYSCRGR